MLEQTRQAVHEADCVFFLVDARNGITPIDTHFARWLRKENAEAPVHLVANKVEGYPDRWQNEMDECYQLGMGEAIPMSAEHGEGMTNLIDVLMPMYDKHEKEQEEIIKAHKEEFGAATDGSDDDDVRRMYVSSIDLGRSYSAILCCFS